MVNANYLMRTSDQAFIIICVCSMCTYGENILAISNHFSQIHYKNRIHQSINLKIFIFDAQTMGSHLSGITECKILRS